MIYFAIPMSVSVSLPSRSVRAQTPQPTSCAQNPPCASCAQQAALRSERAQTPQRSSRAGTPQRYSRAQTPQRKISVTVQRLDLQRNNSEDNDPVRGQIVISLISRDRGNSGSGPTVTNANVIPPAIPNDPNELPEG